MTPAPLDPPTAGDAAASPIAEGAVLPSVRPVTPPVHNDPDDPIAAWPIGRLLSTAARLVEHEWAAALEQRGLTHAGLIALHLLDGGALDQTELARRARVEAQTMSRTIDRLERSGLVRRSPDPTDRRRHLVARTGQGDDALEASRALEAEVFPTVGDPELVRYSLLEIIYAASRDRWDPAESPKSS